VVASVWPRDDVVRGPLVNAGAAACSRWRPAGLAAGLRMGLKRGWAEQEVCGPRSKEVFPLFYEF
jgi:hypothetical protein